MNINKRKPLQRFYYLLVFYFLFLECIAQNKNQQLLLHQLPIDTLDELTFDALTSVKKNIGSARIVMLGEPDHDHGNIFEAKIQLVKFIHQEMGYNAIAFESGLYDMYKANEAIRNGDDVKQALANSIFPIWVNTKEFFPLIEYIEEHKNNLQIMGFDSQFSGEYIYENLKSEIEKIIEDRVSKQVLDSWYEHVETMASDYIFIDNSEIFNRFIICHKQISHAMEEVKRLTKDNKEDIDFYLQVMNNVENMALDYYHNKVSDKSEKEWKAKDSNIRDKLMASNLVYLANKYPNRKIICWGPTAHFANKVWLLKNEELKNFCPMGSHVKKTLGEDQVYILGFTSTKVSQTVALDSTIEQSFIKTGSTFGFLNLKNLPHDTPFKSQCLSFRDPAVYGLWSEVIDGLLFLDTIKLSTPYVVKIDESVNEKNSKVISYEKNKNLNRKKDKKEHVRNTYFYKKIKGHNNQIVSISGKVVDAETQQAIPFANVGIRETFFGTSADTQGNFTLKIPKHYPIDTISISCIGYQQKSYVVNNFKENISISLIPFTKELKEVILSSEPLTANMIMKKVAQNLTKNYIQTPYKQTRIYKERKWSKKEGKYYLHEDLREVYDDNGYQSVPMYPIRYEGFHIYKQARIATIDTVTGKVGEYTNSNFTIDALIATSDVVDMRNNNFLNKKLFSKYIFEFSDVISTHKGEQYLISFKAKNPKHRNTGGRLAPLEYNGTLLINPTDFAILKVTSTTIQEKDKIWQSKMSPAYENEPVWIEKETIAYKKVGNYYYLDKLYHFSNWELEKKGFVEVLGLDVVEGKQPKYEPEKSAYLKTKSKYNPNDWKKFGGN